MGKSRKTVNHKAKTAQKVTVKATQPPVVAPAAPVSNKKPEKAAKQQQGGSRQQISQQGMRARESDERKTLLRNRIEIKRLTSQVQRTKDIAEGKDEDKKEDDWKYRCGKTIFFRNFDTPAINLTIALLFI